MAYWRKFPNFTLPPNRQQLEPNQYQSTKQEKRKHQAEKLVSGPPHGDTPESRKLQRRSSAPEKIPQQSLDQIRSSQALQRETPTSIPTWLSNVEPAPPPPQELDNTYDHGLPYLEDNSFQNDEGAFFAHDSGLLPGVEDDQQADLHPQTPAPPSVSDRQDEQSEQNELTVENLEADIEKLLYISSVSGDSADGSEPDFANWEELFNTPPPVPQDSPSPPLLSHTRNPIEDPTVENIHTPTMPTLSAFETALALWERRHNVSRKGHRELVEVLKMVKHAQELQNLPTTKDTLKNKLVKSLPLLPLRRRTVDVDISVLPSRSKRTDDVVAFDLRAFLQVYLSSEINLRTIYRGMAKLTDGPVLEPWEARWWGESIRTCSGHCIRDTEGRPIWPSDFIHWICNDEGSEKRYLGRVIWCGYDCRLGYDGSPVLRVQQVFSTTELPEDLAIAAYQVRFSRGSMSPPSFDEPTTEPPQEELVIILGDGHLINPHQVVGRIDDVHLDYEFNPSTRMDLTLEHRYTVRYVYDPTFNRDRFRAVRFTTPLRAEKEIATFGRAYLEKMFTDASMISLPFFLFSDAFGLFRNMYRSLMGLYLIPQFTERHLRNRRKSLVPLTLGPFGTELSDTLECLAHLTELDDGMYLDVGGERLFVCSFIGAIIGDMPNQQLLSGCLGPKANVPCRYCMIEQPQRSELGFNIVEKGRYGEQLRRDISRVREIPVKAQQQKELTKLGLHGKWRITDILESLFPSLDLIRSRPSDAAHSEYAGLAKFIFGLLFDDPGFFTAKALESFTKIFNSFTFPPGWRRLQSPTRHLLSWRMQECARGIIILPIIFRIWLKKHHIKAPIQATLKQLGKDFFRAELFQHDVDSFSSAEWLTAACWVYAKSVLSLCGSFSYSANIAELHQKVIDGRRAVQFLIQACINAKRLHNSNQQITYSPSEIPGYTPSYIFSEIEDDAMSVVAEGTVASGVTRPGRANRNAHPLEVKKGLPNIHVGLHYPEIAMEYGGCNMVFTLSGEDRHKMFKDDIKATNFQDAAATLIFRENFRITVAFAFDGCFKVNNPQLNQIFQEIRRCCPSLTSELETCAEDEEQEMESESRLRGDVDHQKPLAFCKMRYAKNEIDAERFVGVRHPRDLPRQHLFRSALRKAYSEDYGVPSVIELGGSPFEWKQKMSFANRSQDRLCFSIGDFLKVRGNFARLQGLFIHHRATSNYLFAVVDFLSPRLTGQMTEMVLKMDIFELNGNREIVGLPSISHERVWMVPRYGETFLFVDYDVYFM